MTPSLGWLTVWFCQYVAMRWPDVFMWCCSVSFPPRFFSHCAFRACVYLGASRIAGHVRTAIRLTCAISPLLRPTVIFSFSSILTWQPFPRGASAGPCIRSRSDRNHATLALLGLSMMLSPSFLSFICSNEKLPCRCAAFSFGNSIGCLFVMTIAIVVAC